MESPAPSQQDSQDNADWAESTHKKRSKELGQSSGQVRPQVPLPGID